MVQAKKGDTVKVHYTGKFTDGMLFDTSEGAEPVEFKIGEGKLISGFEEAVIDMGPGDTRTVTIPPEKAYGFYREDKVITMDRKDFPEDITPEEGMTLEVCAPSGQFVPVQVTEVKGDKITLDANNPLAERDLVFDIRLMEIIGQGEGLEKKR